MDTILDIVISFIAGLGLGMVNYSVLWITVQKVAGARRPALPSIVSFILRMGITLTGFYLVMNGQGERLGASVAGFFLVRSVVARHVIPVNTHSKKLSRIS